MKQRKIYWRRKEGKIVAEGKHKNKTIYLFQLPSIEFVAKSSLFTQEKQQKIMEKISRLDYLDKQPNKQEKELRTTKITRSFENDDKEDFDPDKTVNEFMNFHGLKDKEKQK